ncbi:unnamed protein product [Adineta ricciae]|uniref:Inositol polyphosphate-related phosphatase domain-containing protein n=1 Tax=Adineta ricciae TaxID=249248 RepID=A0A815WZS4_ADIRI|nr:unnamed protein product [Adineta ricciae]
MTDDSEESPSTQRRPSSVPPLSSVTEEESTPTIAALLNTIPVLELATASATDTSSTRSRRRSSVSILHTLVTSSILLPTHDARKRNFLVGSSRQMPDDAANDLSACFPNGRLLTVMMATWNTGEASNLYEQNYTPAAKQQTEMRERMLGDLEDILLPTFVDYVSDVIIMCTQEVSVAKKPIDWEVLLQEVVGPTHVLFHSVHFGTLSLCIFLRRDLIWYCTEPEEDIVKFRAVGAVRTKASLAVTFNLFGTSFMIINSHFEAGENVEGRANRKLNFQNTKTKITIPQEFIQRTCLLNKHSPTTSRVDSLKRAESSSSLDSGLPPSTDMTKACDFVFWAGDFNFRVSMSHKDAVELCKEKKYDALLLHDEFLDADQKHSNAFNDFQEAKIEFAPTYKYDLSSGNDSYAKNRTPSYTDRILYRVKPASQIECTEYRSVENVRHSDHKPVVAHFRVKLKPGLHTGNLSYGKFNHEVYRRGCEQRARRHTLGVGVRGTVKRRTGAARSSVCVVQ